MLGKISQEIFVDAQIRKLTPNEQYERNGKTAWESYVTRNFGVNGKAENYRDLVRGPISQSPLFQGFAEG